MIRKAPLVALLLAALGAPVARAHSDAWFDTRPSAHGGQTRMAGPIHIELVRGADALVLYITDHADQPQASAGGEAALRFPDQDLRVTLAPAGDNRFSASWPAGVPRDAVAVAFVRLAGQEAQGARFAPAQTAPPAADHAGHDGHMDHADHGAHAH